MSSSDNLNALITEHMAKMEDTLTTKKEIDEYYKAGWRIIKEKIKEEKKKVGPTKRPKKVNLDEDGNEIEKVKKPPTEYQQFMRDNKDNVKENFPELKNSERFAKIAELWRKHKEDKAKESETKESETKESDTEEEKKKTPKEEKAPRKTAGAKAGTKK